jgi:hypothetical protein
MIPVPSSSTLLLGLVVVLGAVFILFAVVTVMAWWQHRREAPGRAQRRADLAERERQASVLAAQRRQAEVAAADARARLAAAEWQRAVAWDELERAQAAYEAVSRRHREATERAARLPARTSAVTQAAYAAYRRGDLSQDQLWRLWNWGTGRDPELDALERDLLQAQAARREARLHYQVAAARVRSELASVEVAEVRVRAIAEEVATAAIEPAWEDRADDRG